MYFFDVNRRKVVNMYVLLHPVGVGWYPALHTHEAEHPSPPSHCSPSAPSMNPFPQMSLQLAERGVVGW